jgi:hypothetical protein
LLIKAKFNRFAAILFAAAGFFIVLSLYWKFYDGSFVQAAKSPISVLLLLVPFLPAAFLARRAQKLEKKLFMLLKDSEDKNT